MAWGNMVNALAIGLLLASNACGQVITSDTYFYGQSPPVYPSPAGTGAGDWATAFKKAQALVAKMTTQEKVNLTAGSTSNPTGCSGYISGAASVGFPGLCLSDAGNGLRSTDFVNAYPEGFHVGASWNRNLTYTRGQQMGGEFFRKGVNVALGPVVGPLGRIVEGGRNWEGFTNDPYLGGELVYQTIQGFNDAGVITSTKHYILNEQELNRNPSTSNGTTIASVSSNVDDRTLHELYLWSFQEAVRAGTGCIMCSYNRVNNSYACQNSKTLNGILKTELGFQGFVVSDWGAQHAGPDSYNAGLDMAMPSFYAGYGNLTTLYANGSVSTARLNDQATRILAAYYYLNQDKAKVFDTPGFGMAKNYYAPHTTVNAKKNSAKHVILQGAIEGHVLVKNTNNALPLKNPQLISLFGYGGQAQATYDIAQTIASSPLGYSNGSQFSAGGSGYNNPAYISDPLSAFQQRAYTGGSSILWDFNSRTPNVDQSSDACFVFINAYATEGSDRPGLRDDVSDGIVLSVASHCSNTIVVIHNAGVRLVDTFQSHPNVTAIIFAHTPGQDLGRAIVQLVYGDSEFTGRLQYTVAQNESDYGAILSHTTPSGIYQYFPQSNFSEGLYIDYKAFDASGITPRYEFGFGLGYTTFAYSGLSVSRVGNPGRSYPANANIVPGGNPNLFTTVATVSATVTNTGLRDGTEVPQLYIGIPGGPVRQLRGFEKVTVARGASTTVTFNLRRKDLSIWDTTAQQWLLQAGTYNVYVGSSSRKLPLTGTLTI